MKCARSLFCINLQWKISRINGQWQSHYIFVFFFKEISHFPTRFAPQTPGDLAFPPPLLLPSFSRVDVAARRRVVLVYPSLVATLAPRRRLQFDLSITRGGFARASAANVRSLFEGEKSRLCYIFDETRQFHPCCRDRSFDRRD